MYIYVTLVGAFLASQDIEKLFVV